METIKNYKSYNENKSIEELQFNLLQDINNLEHLKLELEFYSVLLEKPIFKIHVINLYERLSDLKHDIQSLDSQRLTLLNDIYLHSNHIEQKIECDDMACDAFFIHEHDAVALRIFEFNQKVKAFKFNFFQYLESVLIN